jgi:hypothetical protein
MEIIETKSGKQIKVTRDSVRESVRHAHKLIREGLPGGEPGPLAIDPATGNITERATGKPVGKIK